MCQRQFYNETRIFNAVSLCLKAGPNQTPVTPLNLVLLLAPYISYIKIFLLINSIRPNFVFYDENEFHVSDYDIPKRQDYSFNSFTH